MHGILSKKVVEIIIKGGQEKAYSISLDKTAWSICHFLAPLITVNLNMWVVKVEEQKGLNMNKSSPNPTAQGTHCNFGKWLGRIGPTQSAQTMHDDVEE